MHWEFGDPFAQNQKKFWTILGKPVKDATVGSPLLRVNACSLFLHKLGVCFIFFLFICVCVYEGGK